MKIRFFLALALPVSCLVAQDRTTPASPIPNSVAPPMLQRPYEAAKDFFNLSAFASGVFDSNGSYLAASTAGSGLGTVIGGAASGYHQFASGSLSLDYRGDYRSYTTAGFRGGTDQSLAFFGQKITRRWTFTLGETGGIFYAGGVYYSTAPNIYNPSALAPSSPLSVETRFLSSTLDATYQHSARLSYEFTGTYFLERYNGGVQSIGSNNFIGSFSTIYRLTRKTSVSGTYSHSNFLYQNNGGTSIVDTFFGTAGHTFSSRWQVSVSGGVTRASSQGTVLLPLLLQSNQGLIPVYVTGNYNSVTLLPYYQGTITRVMRHSNISISGGETVGPGNGFYLASKTVSANGLYIYSLRRAKLSAGAYFDRLASIANTVNARATSIGVDAAYSYNLMRHFGVSLQYDYIKYSNIGTLNVPSDDRISFGVYFTSKDIPLGWH